MERNKKKDFYLSFQLGKETFAVPVKKVLEVLQNQTITEVPDAIAFVRGVIHFRGDIIPVVDARIKFNMNKLESFVDEFIVVFEILNADKKLRLGATVDLVKDVLSFDPKDIKPIPEIGLQYNAEYVSGLIKIDSGFIITLNVDRIFSTNELIQLDKTYN